MPIDKKVLFVSNGHGEDQIAVLLIQALLEIDPSIHITAIPLVGEGYEYAKIGIQPLIQNKAMPSGGFLREIKHILKDLKAGLIQGHIKQRDLIRSVIDTVSFTVAIGDIFSLFMAGKRNPKPVYFLPTAKSNLFMPHNGIERQMMRRMAAKVFPRDQETAEALTDKGIQAEFCGNPMMDSLQVKANSFGFEEEAEMMGLLPGSRDEAYANLVKILDVVGELALLRPKCHYICAKAKSLDLTRIQHAIEATPWALCREGSNAILRHSQTGVSVLVTEDFMGVLNVAHLFIGLSGTANEQAVAFNKPVFSFIGSGSQSTEQRFKEQRRLLGDLLHYSPKTCPKELANWILDGMKALQPTGKHFKPQDPAAPRIINAILKGD